MTYRADGNNQASRVQAEGKFLDLLLLRHNVQRFPEHVVNYDEEPWKDCVEKFRVFRSQQSPEFIDKLDDAMRVIDEIFEQYT